MTPPQPDMFEQQLCITPPAQMQEPRLWVKRLAIWEKPGDPPLQDVPLRPGLNIVWTPDDNGIGHGGGKTLFCRLLRYCLGEDKFAPEEQRDRISSAFPNGWVGTEVVLDGACWAVLRPLGVRRRHFAVQGGNLDELVISEMPATGLSPLLKAIEENLLTPGVRDLISEDTQGHEAWQIALALLSRDQECRFDHVLDWRSSLSDSESPARGLNRTERLEVLRALLNAIDPSEQALRVDIAAMAESSRSQEQEIGHHTWEIRRLRKQLLELLDVADDALSQGDLGIEILRRAAKERLGGAAKVNDVAGVTDIDSARQAHESAQAEVARIEADIQKQEAIIPVIERAMSALRGEFPTLAYSLKEAENYPCPICEVPIDRVLANQCGLSHKIPDLEACKARLENGKKALKDEQDRLDSAKSILKQLRPNLALAKQSAARNEQHYQNLLKLRERQDGAWYAARKSVDDVEHLASLLEQQKSAEARLDKRHADIEQARERIVALQSQNATAFSKLAQKFDPIVRRLIGAEASGEIRLTGNGLSLIVQMGGDRSTSAIDSLKVVAFDLATLCMSIEGETRLPAFLVHDSPREADLGLALYHGLFHLVRELEGIGSAPLFQYIVTTTTSPPQECAQAPWVVMQLRGSPASSRLLKRDL
ncbi:ATPase involved in DNA repair [Burkholderia pseudomallei]|nr:ATPase involved in DNA repair [Burkholderia pseudomallei]CAJ7287344.1 ATPase involved in DNA repair [Burkholderia pseudomallei]CAJ8989688.1 ATPase involved in DNA repair [Burkholderia pseudomallei]